ncbi:16S rRNA (guanine(527)-N(7))-methyltransferase RsmG [Sphingomonas jaspsi]|uniref:16S rRNA (guanine(527)-N(7))-methyltransferase RsmG n=1 Tax=Sphingomonas jaspsi TaxID=392409 RepID=UPI0004B47C83|nr:16S rRNA (guanine(527)-N(7))-methyltransferase RsmG [Sphingomonas jaspsi]
MIDRLDALSGRTVPRETLEKIQLFVAMLLEENAKQNLISSKTVEQVWERHIYDAAQLVTHSTPSERWCDIGSGPGLPGVIIAILGSPIMLIEPRRLRVEFLSRVVEALDLQSAAIFHGKAERCAETFDVITARAVAALPKLFGLASHLAHSGTKWVLPKGQSAKSELDDARRTWQGVFELVPSMTSPDASIVIAQGVKPRGER